MQEHQHEVYSILKERLEKIVKGEYTGKMLFESHREAGLDRDLCILKIYYHLTKEVGLLFLLDKYARLDFKSC